jgi:hypothetical protein
MIDQRAQCFHIVEQTSSTDPQNLLKRRILVGGLASAILFAPLGNR